jgi:hypothetical protein
MSETVSPRFMNFMTFVPTPRTFRLSLVHLFSILLVFLGPTLTTLFVRTKEFWPFFGPITSYRTGVRANARSFFQVVRNVEILMRNKLLRFARLMVSR